MGGGDEPTADPRRPDAGGPWAGTGDPTKGTGGDRCPATPQNRGEGGTCLFFCLRLGYEFWGSPDFLVVGEPATFTKPPPPLKLALRDPLYNTYPKL